MNPTNDPNAVWKQHLRDFVKGLVAAAAMAAVQAVLQYLTHVDWPTILGFATKALAAVVAIKVGHNS